MENSLQELLIPVVKGQAIDAVAQPTFGRIDVVSEGGTSATILVRSNKTSVVVGERFKATVSIATNDLTINEYRIVLEFDPSKFSVVDSDLNTTGTQVKLLDSLFLVENPETDNIVSSGGRIRLVAKTQTGNPFQVNRDVAEIEFQAQSIGASTIKIVQGTTGSQLIRQSGTGISFTPNEISIQIGTEQIPTNPVTTDPSSRPNLIPSDSPAQGVTIIPATSFRDDVLSVLPILIGLILIIGGTKLYKSVKRKNGNLR